MDYFTLSAGPNTDLWRKPPDRETSTAPIIYTALRQAFVIAEVTVTADWEMEWDQGGLVIFAGAAPREQPQSPSETPDSQPQPQPQQHPPPYPIPPSNTPCKWVKAGFEFSAGAANASSVSATADGADWCLAPLISPNVSTPINSVRIKLERIGHSLWVWYQVPGGSTHAHAPGVGGNSWRKLREVTWFFWGVEDKHVYVGVYASRPANFSVGNTVWAARNTARAGSGYGVDYGGGGKLAVEFEDLEIF